MLTVVMGELGPMKGEETNRRAKASVAIVKMRFDVCIFLDFLLSYILQYDSTISEII